MSTTITSRTMMDALKESKYMTEVVTPEQFEAEGSGVDNEGDLLHVLQKYKSVKERLNIVCPGENTTKE